MLPHVLISVGLAAVLVVPYALSLHLLIWTARLDAEENRRESQFDAVYGSGGPASR